ncbi:MAG: hypothetical protein AAGG01_13290 [Planctomycetota bacterium]
MPAASLFARLAAALSLAAPGLSQVTNDDCATAMAIGLGSHAISTVGATDGPLPGHCGSHFFGMMANDVWFRYTAAADGRVQASICDATFDTMLELYPDDCSATSPWGCSDDSCNLGSRIEFNGVAGQSYLIRLGGFFSGIGTGTLVIVDEASGPLGQPICLGVPNSTGIGGVLRAFGSARASNNDLTLRAVSLPEGAFTMFLVSRYPSAPTTPMGSVGTLCIGGSIGRFVGEIGPATGGIYSHTINIHQMPVPPTFMARIRSNETWYFQAWFRDSSPAGPTSNFTSGIEITFI